MYKKMYSSLYFQSPILHEFSENVISMERLSLNQGNGQSYGYIVYRKVMQVESGHNITIRGHVRDLLMLMINGQMVNEPILGALDMNKFGSYGPRLKLIWRTFKIVSIKSKILALRLFLFVRQMYQIVLLNIKYLLFNIWFPETPSSPSTWAKSRSRMAKARPATLFALWTSWLRTWAERTSALFIWWTNERDFGKEMCCMMDNLFWIGKSFLWSLSKTGLILSLVRKIESDIQNYFICTKSW